MCTNLNPLMHTLHVSAVWVSGTMNKIKLMDFNLYIITKCFISQHATGVKDSCQPLMLRSHSAMKAPVWDQTTLKHEMIWNVLTLSERSIRSSHLPRYRAWPGEANQTPDSLVHPVTFGETQPILSRRIIFVTKSWQTPAVLNQIRNNVFVSFLYKIFENVHGLERFVIAMMFSPNANCFWFGTV